MNLARSAWFATHSCSVADLDSSHLVAFEAPALILQTSNHQLGAPADLEAFTCSDLPDAIAHTVTALCIVNTLYRPAAKVTTEQDQLAKVRPPQGQGGPLRTLGSPLKIPHPSSEV